MDRTTARAYKRKCFQGRGIVARWLDRVFFSALGGVCLYILLRNLILSLLLGGAFLLLLVLWDRRRWARFRHRLWQRTVDQLWREDWLRQEAGRIRGSGGVLLYPVPDLDTLTGLCLRLGEGTAFHCVGDVKDSLIAAAQALGCSLTFHPWGQGEEPSREQVVERLVCDAPKRYALPWQKLLHLPGNRYLVTGLLLLLLSMILRRALYWRMLGTLCLVIGTVRRSFHLFAKT